MKEARELIAAILTNCVIGRLPTVAVADPANPSDKDLANENTITTRIFEDFMGYVNATFSAQLEGAPAPNIWAPLPSDTKVTGVGPVGGGTQPTQAQLEQIATAVGKIPGVSGQASAIVSAVAGILGLALPTGAPAGVPGGIAAPPVMPAH